MIRARARTSRIIGGVAVCPVRSYLRRPHRRSEPCCAPVGIMFSPLEGQITTRAPGVTDSVWQWLSSRDMNLSTASQLSGHTDWWTDSDSEWSGSYEASGSLAATLDRWGFSCLSGYFRVSQWNCCLVTLQVRGSSAATAPSSSLCARSTNNELSSKLHQVR